MASLIGAFDNPMGYVQYLNRAGERTEEAVPWREQYMLLRAYARNNGLYDALRHLFLKRGYEPERITAIRNPAFRVTEFYAAKLWPGPLPRALPIETDNPTIIPVIEQIWVWSNWNTVKQATARLYATCGDMFLKAATNADTEGNATRVFIQRLNPEVVTYFEKDERGYLTYVRLDTPDTERNERNELVSYTVTEVWDKSTQTMRQWKHRNGLEAELSNLGTPTLELPFSAFGIDFVPIVWQPFRDVGEERGEGAFTPAIDKIDEVNGQAFRLHRTLFRNNRNLWAIQSSAADREGRPVPPPRMAQGQIIRLDEESDPMLEIPSGTLTSLVPNINYDSALNILESQMADIRSDLPELAYYTLRERTDLSGRALRILLSDALDRLVEARGNAEAGLVRAHQMCMTIGSYLGLFRLEGSYEDGSFAHTFAEREVFTPDEFERAQTLQTYTSAGVPVVAAARLAGLDDERVEMIQAEIANEQEQQADMAAVAIETARRRFDQEQNGRQPDEAIPNA